ncbi:hypothetical protein DUNSADRAFT_803 [Dunaliella salina]|uniref:Encoded protein n=1 Tax=Dunaliella salina TaxID=3046 RepID=A0ABQ7FYD1_DUNSA|nr:hypothetical protein DUNSADRAFT_803 [Dunaliella salina]|eukprot:KAF5827352.1 hypothetical protein DUNSADRAFT_803 [Dunaliella salina]
MRATLCAVLALACSTIGCTIAASQTDETGSDPAQPRGKRKGSERYFHPETFAFHNLAYDVHFADELFILSQEPRVLAVDCSTPGELLISVSDVAAATSWKPGTLLVGDKALGCMQDNKVTPFYRRVESIEFADKESTQPGSRSILVEASQVGFEHCFKFADINFRSIPVGHSEHPIFPNKDSLAHNNQSSTDHRRQLLSLYSSTMVSNGEIVQETC